MLADVMLGDAVGMMPAVILGVGMLPDMEVVVMNAPAITLEFVVGCRRAGWP